MNRNFEQRFRRKNNVNSNNQQFNRQANNNANFNSRSSNSQVNSNRYRDDNYNNNNSNNNNNNYNNNNNRYDNNGNQWRSRDNRNRRQLGNKQRPNRFQGGNRRLDNRTDNGGSNADKWYRITVAHCANLEQFYIVNQLQQHGIEFTPFNYAINGNAVEFYVRGGHIAGTIKRLTRRISVPNGDMKLNIAVEQTILPPIDCTNDFIEKLKIVMSNRYEINEKYLNLANMSNEPEFLNMRLFVSLQRINVCKEAVKIIIENIPDLQSLNLSSNNIQSLEPFKPLVASCKNLKKLDLSNNNVNNIDHLDNLKGLNLEELKIDNNPFKKNIKNKSTENLSSLMRLRFSKLMVLDDVALPAIVGFDVEDSTAMPEIRDSFIPDNYRDFATAFVTNYFKLYDSDNRQSLLDSYFDQANFSFSINKDARGKQRPFEMNLMRESRNLLAVHDDDLRDRLLRKGKAQVVAALSNLPKTEHILDSFKIDIPPLGVPNYVLVIVNGLYKTKQRPFNLRAFTRHFLIVHHNGTYAIANDLFIVTNPTVEQINFAKNLYKNDPNSQDMNFMDSDEMNVNNNGLASNDLRLSLNNNQTNVMNNNFVNPNVNPIVNPAVNAVPNMHQPIASTSFINQQQQQPHPIQIASPAVDPLVKRFSEVTGMNYEYSSKCLADYDNDPEKALIVFKQLHEQNQIPAIAFQH